MKNYVDKKRNAKPLKLSPGDHALVKKKPENKYFNPQPFEIVDVKGNQIDAESSEDAIRRNSTFFRRVPQPSRESTEVLPSTSSKRQDQVNDNIEPDEHKGDEDSEVPRSPTTVLRRSKRVRRPPNRYGYEDY